MEQMSYDLRSIAERFRSKAESDMSTATTVMNTTTVTNTVTNTDHWNEFFFGYLNPTQPTHTQMVNTTSTTTFVSSTLSTFSSI